MIVSDRKIGEELAFYRALGSRSRLSAEDAKKLSVLERGYVGECIYDKVFEDVGHGSIFVFRDIYLRIEDGIAQYDALIVSDDGIVVNEIKNFSGLYRYEAGKWFIQDYQVSNDALAQVKRAVGKLLKLRYAARGNFEVSGKIVFPHIEFRLRTDDADLWNNVVLRSELRNYLMQFKNAYAGREAENIARLIQSHIVPNPFFDKSADFDAVRKGVYCGACGSFEMVARKYHFICKSCGSKETKESHMIRAMSDFKSLFLKQKMTKKIFLEFIDYRVSPKTALRMLDKYCERNLNGSFTNYTFKYEDFEDACENSNRLWRYKDRVVNSDRKLIRN